MHYAANAARFLGSPQLSDTLALLFATPSVDFNIQDVDGNTPVHYAAQCCKYHPKTCEYVFPNLSKKLRKMDLISQNKMERAILFCN